MYVPRAPHGTVATVTSTLRYDNLTSSAFVRGFVLEVPFPFASKSNFRRFASRGATNAWTRFARFEDALSAIAVRARPVDWENPGVDVALSLRPVLVVSLYARTTLDSGNLPKSVLDALENKAAKGAAPGQEILYANDAQVAHCSALTTRTKSDQRGYVAIAQLKSGASPEEVLRAGHELDCLAWAWWLALDAEPTADQSDCVKTPSEHSN